MGDFNARIGTNADFVSFDEEDSSYLPMPLEWFSQIPSLNRVSKDDVINEHGMHLLNQCKASGFRIANGRLFQDKDIGNLHATQYEAVV